MKAFKDATGLRSVETGKADRIRRSGSLRVIVIDRPPQVIRAKSKEIASSIDGALRRLASK